MRISTLSTLRRVLYGLRQNQAASIRAQEQLSSGRRILRPSDDPVGATKSIRIEHRLADVSRYRRAIGAGLRTVEAGSSTLSQASSLMTEARELLLQGMNGTLNDDDRESIASEFDLIRQQLLDLGNERSGEKYLFAGTATADEPWREITVNGRTRIVYGGDSSSQSIHAGEQIDVELTMPGTDVFGAFEPTITIFGGLTGATGGTTADEGTGFLNLTFRHESTDPGALASVGVALVSGGLDDTLLGANALTIDGTAGTVSLGSGEAVPLPPPGTTDFVVTNELGAELHLDFSGYTGGDLATTVTGNGSVSLDGSTFVALDFAQTDLELSDPGTGSVVHVNTTGVRRAGEELVEFGGRTNVFDAIAAIAEDLRNPTGLDRAGVMDRLESRLEDLQRHHENLLVGVGVLGSRGRRLQVADQRSADLDIELQSRLSDVADADLAEVAIDLSRSEYLLQIAQASGARLLQTSLLDFLG
jgi:flagellar hook-associated protein 3 FlgL